VWRFSISKKYRASILNYLPFFSLFAGGKSAIYLERVFSVLVKGLFDNAGIQRRYFKRFEA
jgi:hypothetical protein